MTDMNAILSRSAAAVEPPKALPPGQYMFRVMSVDDSTTSSGGNPQVIFQVQAEAPIDVDQAQLAGVTFPSKMRHNYVVTENSLYRLVDFMNLHLGVPKEGFSVKEMIPQTIGKMFRGDVTHQASNKPGNNTLYANITGTSVA